MTADREARAREMPVTIDDDEAARDWVLHNWPSWQIGASEARKSIAKLLACHRRAALAEGRAQGMEEAAGIAEGCDLNVPLSPGCPDGASMAATQICAAIRQQIASTASGGEKA